MPVISSVIDSGLKVLVQTGMDDDGLPVVRSRNFSRVKPEATDEAIYNVGDQLGQLQQYPVTAIRKVTESDLIFE
ncbi:MAG: hypothetical protein APF76_14975 [Desulfitibacter sp. BRH_c19]|nr:MAG: hypothetical protein APF76_14975 [Desulfitibacter sp. BRH_c19]